MARERVPEREAVLGLLGGLDADPVELALVTFADGATLATPLVPLVPLVPMVPLVPLPLPPSPSPPPPLSGTARKAFALGFAFAGG